MHVLGRGWPRLLRLPQSESATSVASKHGQYGSSSLRVLFQVTARRTPSLGRCPSESNCRSPKPLTNFKLALQPTAATWFPPESRWRPIPWPFRFPCQLEEFKFRDRLSLWPKCPCYAPAAVVVPKTMHTNRRLRLCLVLSFWSQPSGTDDTHLAH